MKLALPKPSSVFVPRPADPDSPPEHREPVRPPSRASSVNTIFTNGTSSFPMLESVTSLSDSISPSSHARATAEAILNRRGSHHSQLPKQRSMEEMTVQELKEALDRNRRVLADETIFPPALPSTPADPYKLKLLTTISQLSHRLELLQNQPSTSTSPPATLSEQFTRQMNLNSAPTSFSLRSPKLAHSYGRVESMGIEESMAIQKAVVEKERARLEERERIEQEKAMAQGLVRDATQRALAEARMKAFMSRTHREDDEWDEDDEDYDINNQGFFSDDEEEEEDRVGTELGEGDTAVLKKMVTVPSSTNPSSAMEDIR